jgi:hypothetical protein
MAQRGGGGIRDSTHAFGKCPEVSCRLSEALHIHEPMAGPAPGSGTRWRLDGDFKHKDKRCVALCIARSSGGVIELMALLRPDGDRASAGAEETELRVDIRNAEQNVDPKIGIVRCTFIRSNGGQISNVEVRPGKATGGDGEAFAALLQRCKDGESEESDQPPESSEVLSHHHAALASRPKEKRKLSIGGGYKPRSMASGSGAGGLPTSASPAGAGATYSRHPPLNLWGGTKMASRGAMLSAAASENHSAAHALPSAHPPPANTPRAYAAHPQLPHAVQRPPRSGAPAAQRGSSLVPPGEGGSRALQPPRPSTGPQFGDDEDQPSRHPAHKQQRTTTMSHVHASGGTSRQRPLSHSHAPGGLHQMSLAFNGPSHGGFGLSNGGFRNIGTHAAPPLPPVCAAHRRHREDHPCVRVARVAWVLMAPRACRVRVSSSSSCRQHVLHERRALVAARPPALCL